MMTGRSRTTGLGAVRGAVAGALVALLAACGTTAPVPAGGTSPPATSHGSPTSTPTSTPPTTTETTTEASVVVPSDVLETALVTKVVGKAYTLDAEDAGDYWMPGGLDITFYGEFVSGDRGCQGLLQPHSAEAEAFAYVAMSNKSTEFSEVVESYTTVAEAKRVMAENVSQAKSCRTFKMKDEGGELVRYKHTVTAAKEGDIDMFLHHFNGRGEEYEYEFHMFEGRVGGEMMHMTWSSFAKTDPSSAAWTHFQKVINAYRQEHPRPGDGAVLTS